MKILKKLICRLTDLKINLKDGIKTKVQQNVVTSVKPKIFKFKKFEKVIDFCTDEEKAFLCFNGETYHSLKELSQALVKMSQDTFNYHVNVERNDFSNWIRNVFHTDGLADLVLDAKTPKQLQSKIDLFLR